MDLVRGRIGADLRELRYFKQPVLRLMLLDLLGDVLRYLNRSVVGINLPFRLTSARR